MKKARLILGAVCVLGACGGEQKPWSGWAAAKGETGDETAAAQQTNALRLVVVEIDQRTVDWASGRPSRFDMQPLGTPGSRWRELFADVQVNSTDARRE